MDWKISNKKVSNYPCLQSKHNMNAGFRLPAEYETTIMGHWGEIYEYGPGRYGVVLNSAKRSNKVLPDNKQFSNNEETRLIVEEKDLQFWIKHIQAPKSSKRQLEIAKRQSEKSRLDG